MNKKLSIWLPLLVGVSVAIGIVVGTNFNPRYAHHPQLITNFQEKNDQLYPQIGRVEEIIRFIEHSYVDSVNTKALSIHAINDVLSELDPFSNYISQEDLEEYNNQLEGVFKGIGINYIQWQDSIFIVNVLKNSPAKEAGLKRGDIIWSINGDTVSSKQVTIDNIRSKILGDENDIVKIDYLSNDDNSFKTVELKIKEIPLMTTKSSYLINEKTIYLKIDRFSSNTYKQFIQSLEAVTEVDKVYNIILDLRDNPGGYLPETIKILSQFFKEKKKLLTYTEGAKRSRKEYESTGQQFFNFDKIAILINSNSASGSEIIAGAIQDWDRGVIIGETSFGKGLVQEIHELKNGGAIRLTVARYMTPSGRSIQKDYQLQDSVVAAKDDLYASKLLERKLNGGGGIEPDIPIQDEFIYKNCAEINFLSIQAFLLRNFPLQSPYSDFNSCLDSLDINKKELENYNQFVIQNSSTDTLTYECLNAFKYTASSFLIEYWYSELEAQIFTNRDNIMIQTALEAFEKPNLQALLTKEN